MPSEIAVPFRLDGNGRVVVATNPDDQVRQHVLALVNTHPYERAMVPGYGLDVLGLLFQDPEEVGTQVSLRVRTAMQVHEPGVELISAEPEVTREGDDESITRVGMEYRRLDAPDSTTLANANVAIIGSNGAVRDIVRG